jgi:hypothetical protein
MNMKLLRIVLSVSLVAFLANSVVADETTPAASQPEGGDLRYEVYQVGGTVRVSPTGTDPLGEAGWKQLKEGDLLQAGQQVHTSLRGKIKLVARPSNPPTVLYFEPGSLINISELNFKDGAATSRMQISYGAVRAGVAEGTTRSDMEIESPAATLSKRGTDIFRMEYVNGRYNISLSDQGRGMLQAIQTGRTGLSALNSRFITPGQFITHQLARAIDSMQFDRKVNVTDSFGLGGADQLFTMINDRGGFGFLLPQGNNVGGVVGGLGKDNFNQPQGPQDGQNNGQQGGNNLFGPLGRNVRAAPGGDFGIGQGPLPNLFGPQRKSLLRPSVNPLKRR